MKSSRDVSLTDLEPGIEQMRDEVVDGLTQRRKTISSKYFYDLRGSQLFDRICELDEYYPTRTELGIMRDSIDEIAELTGPSCLLIEFGSGSSLKTRILLDHLKEVAAYVPVDISKAHLLASAKEVNSDYPALKVLPVCADFTAQFEVPECDRPIEKRLLYFPGSTIGNLQPDKAVDLLR
ncbi:MAG: L-histidine N(alpha)-methyltransferase, partial [Planctomycetota bacterium]|nr:L-histidine N(alpha)-methyltransferase [Planctomycetota bacterium]